jgi:hypothetical protein
MRIEKQRRLTMVFLLSNPHSAIRIPQSSGDCAATPTAHAVFLFDEEADEAEREAEDEEREEDDPTRRADAFGDDGRRG